MARKLKPDTGIDPDPAPKRGRGRPKAPPPPSNVTDETIKEFCDRALAAKIELEKAEEEAKSKRGIYRQVLKDAKKAGVDQDAIAWWLAARKREPDDIDRETRNRNRIARLMGLPIGTQLGLWDDGESVATKAENDRAGADAAGTKADAYADGLARGKAGKPMGDHGYTGELEDEYERGWKDGQYQIVQSMGGNGAAHANA